MRKLLLILGLFVCFQGFGQVPFMMYSNIKGFVEKSSDYQTGIYLGVTGDGSYIYTSCNSAGLRSYSVNSSGSLTFIDRDDQGYDYYGVYTDTTYIYAATNNTIISYSADVSGNLTYIDELFAILNDLYYYKDYIIAVGYRAGSSSYKGLFVYSVDGSGNITQVDQDYQSGDYQDVWSDGTYIYVASSNGLLSYSVDGSGNLTYIDIDQQDNDDDYGVWGDGTYIYVAGHDKGIRSYSVDGSGNLTFIDQNYQDFFYEDVWGDGTYIYVATSFSIQSYTVDGLGNITFVDEKQNVIWNEDIWFDGTFIYSAGQSDGLYVYEYNE